MKFEDYHEPLEGGVVLVHELIGVPPIELYEGLEAPVDTGDVVDRDLFD